MSRRFNKCAVAALVLLTSILFTGIGHAQVKILKSATWVPPVHHMNATLGGWVKEVERASGGTLKIQVLPPGLAKPPGQYDLAKNGVTDLSWGVPAYTQGRFPVVRVLELPFITPSAEIGSMSLWEWYEKHGMIEKEFGDTHLVMVFAHGPGLLHTKKPVTSLEDIKGLKIRSGGGGALIAKAWNAVPFAVPATKTHESLQRGTSDGVFFPWEAVKSFRLAKLATHHLQFPGGLYATPFFMTMNKKSWKNLSPAHKNVLNRVGRLWGSQFMGRGWDAADHGGKAAAKANGNTIRTVSPSEFKRFKAKVAFAERDWIARVNKKGHNGKALLADLKKIIARNSR